MPPPPRKKRKTNADVRIRAKIGRNLGKFGRFVLFCFVLFLLVDFFFIFFYLPGVVVGAPNPIYRTDFGRVAKKCTSLSPPPPPAWGGGGGGQGFMIRAKRAEMCVHPMGHGLMIRAKRAKCVCTPWGMD